VLPRALQRQLNSEHGGKQNIQFTRLHFLQISGRNFSALRQLVLSQALSATFPAHIGTKNFQPVRFFRAERHDTLRRVFPAQQNDALNREIILALSLLPCDKTLTLLKRKPACWKFSAGEQI